MVSLTALFSVTKSCSLSHLSACIAGIGRSVAKFAVFYNAVVGINVIHSFGCFLV